MIPSLLESLSTIALSEREQRQLGLGSATLVLRRAWPRAADHLLLEYLAGEGQIVPAQWFAAHGRCAAVAAETGRTVAGSAARPPARSALWRAPQSEAPQLLLQVGVDRRLPGLTPLLARPDATLLVHRPERRAVLRLGRGAGARYAKIVPPRRVAQLVAMHQAAVALTHDLCATPALVASEQTHGAVIFAALAGRSLYELLDAEPLVAAAAGLGRTLARFHHAPEPVRLPTHFGGDEAQLLERWVVLAQAYCPELREALASALPPACELLAQPPSRIGPLHRDLYDKQVFVADDGAIGLLDFDTLACGEPALDLANVLAHLELRALQGCCSWAMADAAARALLAGYDPPAATRDRLPCYLAATRLRLACVYAFRPRWRQLVPALIELAQPGKARSVAA
jgi:Ser/Thr protein kinase RdoA (MazF antagonist)